MRKRYGGRQKSWTTVAVQMKMKRETELSLRSELPFELEPI